MSNTFLCFLMIIANFAMIIIAFRFWGKLGLTIWMPISCIVANIQVTKTIILFGIEATLGNVVYATSFLATDILAEFYSKEDADRAVIIGLFSLLCMTLFMQLAIAFKPSPNDISSSALSAIFHTMPRITLASVIAYAISNYHDIRAFLFWKKATSGKHLWLRNNASTIISQLIDSVIFTLGAFLFVYPKSVLIQIIISTYVFKFFTALLDTGMIYIAKSMIQKNKIKDLRKDN